MTFATDPYIVYYNICVALQRLRDMKCIAASGIKLHRGLIRTRGRVVYR
jgi:hypothetical protein